MPKATLTKKKIDSLKFTDKRQVIYWDRDVRARASTRTSLIYPTKLFVYCKRPVIAFLD